MFEALDPLRSSAVRPAAYVIIVIMEVSFVNFDIYYPQGTVYL